MGAARAIVTEIPGTTRDLLTEIVDIEGTAITLVDTAGLHGAAADAVEQEGIARARSARDIADLVLVVLDQSRPLTTDDHDLLDAHNHGLHNRPERTSSLVVANKSDLPPAWDLAGVPGAIAVSAKDGSGFDELRGVITAALGGGEWLRDAPAITNARHIDLLSRAAVTLRRGADAADTETPEEFVTADVAEARALLEEVTGTRTAEDVLRAIFDRFCIGK